MSPLPTRITENVRIAADIIRSAHHAIVLTGAGSSTPSGIPDFRSPGSGLWTRYSPMDVASLSTFRYQPEKFFEWLRPLASEMIQAQPNPSHIAFSKLENNGNVKAIITQNIDGLHQKAGSKKVIEVHGSLNSLSCIGCYRQYPSDGFLEAYIQNGDIPYCPNCNRILKPDVVLFEEQLPVRSWLKAKRETNACDLMIVAGSSLQVTPVAGLPMQAFENRAKIIMINKTPTYIDECAEVVFYGDVADIVPEIASEVILV
jgi:NAD-dependent deacetylase